MKKNIILFGASSSGQAAFMLLKNEFNIICFCDNDPGKWGGKLSGIKIIPPSQLRENPDSKVVITSSFYEEISNLLVGMGIYDFEIFNWNVLPVRDKLSERGTRELNKRIVSEKQFKNAPRIFVLGHQKSGTSAIASLLSHKCGLKSTIDIPEFYLGYLKIRQRKMSFLKFIEENVHRFYTDIIKEPELTFFYEELKEIFTNARFLFIVRHPISVIRSILDRAEIDTLKLPMSYTEASKMSENGVWEKMLSAKSISYGETQEITEAYALRWVKAARLYIANEDTFILAKYEDFVMNKLYFVDDLADKLGLCKKNPINELCEIQYQPKGKNREKNINELFTNDVIKKVESICENEMRQMGYQLYSEKSVDSPCG